MSLRDVQDLLNKIIKEEKKPKLNKPIDLKETVTGMKQIIQVSLTNFSGFKEYLKRLPNLIFYIAAGEDDIVYVLVIFRRSVPVEYPGIKCFKGFSSYWENITWLWKRATFIESHGFICGEELRKNEPTAEQILNLSNDEALSTLSLRDYTLYKGLKEIKE